MVGVGATVASREGERENHGCIFLERERNEGVRDSSCNCCCCAGCRRGKGEWSWLVAGGCAWMILVYKFLLCIHLLQIFQPPLLFLLCSLFIFFLPPAYACKLFIARGSNPSVAHGVQRRVASWNCSGVLDIVQVIEKYRHACRFSNDLGGWKYNSLNL